MAKRIYTFRFSERTIERLRALASCRGCSATAVLEDLIDEANIIEVPVNTKPASLPRTFLVPNVTPKNLSPKFYLPKTAPR